MKKLAIWLLIIFGITPIFSSIAIADDTKNSYWGTEFWNWAIDTPNIWNIVTSVTSESENTNPTEAPNNERLNSISNWWFFNATVFWVEWAENVILSLAKEIKNIAIWLLTILLMISVLRLIFSAKTEEEFTKLKNAIMWSWLAIILMQVSYTAANTLFWTDISWWKAVNFANKVIEPILWIIILFAGLIFVIIAIMSFYTLVSSNWDEWKATEAKKSVINAIIWILLIKITSALITGFYWQIWCANWNRNDCVASPNLNWASKIVVDILNWVNSFILIITTIMIIYTGFLLVFNNWDKEASTRVRSFIKYILIWMAIVATSYIFMEFILLGTWAITT